MQREPENSEIRRQIKVGAGRIMLEFVLSSGCLLKIRNEQGNNNNEYDIMPEKLKRSLDCLSFQGYCCGSR